MKSVKVTVSGRRILPKCLCLSNKLTRNRIQNTRRSVRPQDSNHSSTVRTWNLCIRPDTVCYCLSFMQHRSMDSLKSWSHCYWEGTFSKMCHCVVVKMCADVSVEPAVYLQGHFPMAAEPLKRSYISSNNKASHPCRRYLHSHSGSTSYFGGITGKSSFLPSTFRISFLHD